MEKATLGLCILINQRERNKAIGVSQDTQLQRGLSAYVRSISTSAMRATSRRLARAAYLKALIEEHQALAGRLTDYIMKNLEDDDIRNEGIYIMTQLDAFISHLGNELEALWLPS